MCAKNNTFFQYKSKIEVSNVNINQYDVCNSNAVIFITFWRQLRLIKRTGLVVKSGSLVLNVRA